MTVISDEKDLAILRVSILQSATVLRCCGIRTWDRDETVVLGLGQLCSWTGSLDVLIWS